MGSPTKSLLAYSDCGAIFGRALDSKKGVLIECESHGAAVNLRTRLNTYRKLDRKYSMRMYQPDDPKYGHSDFDVFVVRIARKGAEGDNVVRVERPEYGSIKISDIPSEDLPAPEPPPDLDQLMQDLSGKAE